MFYWSNFLNLIRVLFPKWSFFDQVETRIVVEARPPASDVWMELTLTSVRKFGALFHNPDVNLNHAFENIVREFIRDLKPYLEGGGELSEKELEQIIAFKQVRQWVRLQLTDHVHENGLFQFRLKSEEGEIFFVSHELGMAFE